LLAAVVAAVPTQAAAAAVVEFMKELLIWVAKQVGLLQLRWVLVGYVLYSALQ
jgi:hypothetical protein